MNQRLLGLTLLIFTLALAGCNKPASLVGPPSTPGSSQWTQVTGLTGFFNIVMSGTIMYAAGNYGVFRSTDNGSSWAELDTTLPSGGYTIASSNGTLLIGDYYNNNGIFVSSDGGVSWTPADSGLETSFGGFYQIVNCITSHGSTILAGTSSNGVFRSTDGGRSWKAMNSGIGFGTSVFALASSGTNFIAGTANGVYLTSDNGNSWAASDSGLVNLSPYYSGPPYVVSLAVAAGRVYAGAIGSQVFISQDDGLTWNYISNSLPGSGQSGIGLAASDSTLVVVDDSGVFLTTNDGSSWTNIAGNLPSVTVNSFDEANGFVFIQLTDGSVWRLAI